MEQSLDEIEQSVKGLGNTTFFKSEKPLEEMEQSLKEIEQSVKGLGKSSFLNSENIFQDSDSGSDSDRTVKMISNNH